MLDLDQEVTLSRVISPLKGVKADSPKTVAHSSSPEPLVAGPITGKITLGRVIGRNRMDAAPVTTGGSKIKIPILFRDHWKRGQLLEGGATS
jgi:hypothetical protein